MQASDERKASECETSLGAGVRKTILLSTTLQPVGDDQRRQWANLYAWVKIYQFYLVINNPRGGI